MKLMQFQKIGMAVCHAKSGERDSLLSALSRDPSGD